MPTGPARMSTIPPEPVATIRGMDVTPHELRDAEINEVKRGYDCDAVDELLERAAGAAGVALADLRRAPVPPVE